MSGTGGMSDRGGPAHRRLSSFHTARDPYGRPDLAGWWCRRAAIIGKLLSLVLGDRPPGISGHRIPRDRDLDLRLSTPGGGGNCRGDGHFAFGPTPISGAHHICLLRPGNP